MYVVPAKSARIQQCCRCSQSMGANIMKRLLDSAASTTTIEASLSPLRKKIWMLVMMKSNDVGKEKIVTETAKLNFTNQMK